MLSLLYQSLFYTTCKRGAFVLLLLFPLLFGSFTYHKQTATPAILYYIVNPELQNIAFYWKDERGQILKNFQTLKDHVEKKHQSLVFAMNGGMFTPGFSPQGLFIENHKVLTPVDTGKGDGNFYLSPNGIFYLTTDKQAVVCKTTDFKHTTNIQYATQSGPMLVINGTIHPAFKKGSANLNIRNGVGILPNKQIIFAISETPVNFYDFALFFQQRGCKNALYLDGFVSRIYLPEKKRMPADGQFGVIIGVTQTNSKK